MKYFPYSGCYKSKIKNNKSSLFSFLNHIDDIFQVIGRNLLLFGKERNHFLIRIFKVITYEATHESTFVFAFTDSGCILVRISYACGCNILFTFQVLDDGSYRSVGRCRLGIFGNNVFYEATAQFPDVDHCFFFLYR